MIVILEDKSVQKLCNFFLSASYPLIVKVRNFRNYILTGAI